MSELDRTGAGAEVPLDAQVAAGRLVEAGLVGERRDGHRLAFRSAVLRDAIIQGTPPALAATIHGAAYRFHSGSHDPDSLPSRAYHAARSGHHHESFATYLRIAQEAAARHAYLDAEASYSHALEQKDHAGSPGVVASALRGRGLMRFRLVRYDDALADLEAARQMAAQRSERTAEINISLDVATVLDFQCEFDRMREAVEQARALGDDIPGGPGPVLEARLIFNLGRVAWRFSNDTEAASLMLEAAARAEAIGDASYETYETFVVSLLAGGSILATLGRLDESELAFARVLPVVAARGDRLHVAAVLISRIMLWAPRNQHNRMLADLEQALLIGREIGIPHLESSAQHTMALGLHWMGRSQEAEQHVRRAIEVDDRIMGTEARLESRLLLARIMAVRGDLDGAAEVLTDVHQRLAAGRAHGARAVEPVPAEAVIRDLVDLLVRGGTPAEWGTLAERARLFVTRQDLDEVLRFSGAAARLRC